MRKIKKILLISGVVVSSLNADSCLNNYEKEIEKGNATAMNNFIKNCKSDLPENKISNYIKAREKNFFGSKALECRANAFFYQDKLRLAFDYYSQAASLNNQQAKISMGYIYSNLSNELKKEYEYRVDMPIYTKEEIKNFKDLYKNNIKFNFINNMNKENDPNVLKYKKDCLDILAEKKEIITLKNEKLKKERPNSRAEHSIIYLENLLYRDILHKIKKTRKYLE